MTKKPTSRLILLLVAAFGLAGGCEQSKPYFALARQPDDVELVVLDLHYIPEISGYIFKYNQDHFDDPCNVNGSAYARKDSLVGLQAVASQCGIHRDFAVIWLRHDWDQNSTTQGSKEALEHITPLPGRHPGQ